MGSPTCEGGACCDGGLQGGKDEWRPDHVLGRIGPPHEGGQNCLQNNSGLQIVLVGSVDGEEPQVEETHVQMCVWYDGGMSKERERENEQEQQTAVFGLKCRSAIMAVRVAVHQEEGSCHNGAEPCPNKVNHLCRQEH